MTTLGRDHNSAGRGAKGQPALDDCISRLLKHPYIGEVRELAKQYDVDVGEVQIRVKVYWYPYADTYVAVPDHGVLRSGEAVPYRRMQHLHTPERALEDAVGGLLEHYHPEEGRGCLSRIE
jgi:phosphoribosylformylglycinamidine (FGAM) synthase-like enzyme